MGFHQYQMSRQVLFLPTELNPAQRKLKPTFKLQELEDEDSDIYLQTKLQIYLKRPSSLDVSTFPEFYRWWRSATTEQNKASKDARNITSKGSDDFEDFMNAKQRLDGATEVLSELLSECEVVIRDGYDLLDTCVALKWLKISQPVTSQGVAQVIVEAIDALDAGLFSALCSHHWLMECGLRDELITVLSSFQPGTVVQDADGHFWYRRAKMVCTRHRFISSVGDDQEKYYEQKYLLTIPMTSQSEVVLEPPESLVELCVREAMCDQHLDAMPCMQSAISTNALRELAKVYMDHGFLTENEADIFLSEIPVLGETEE